MHNDNASFDDAAAILADPAQLARFLELCDDNAVTNKKFNKPNTARAWESAAAIIRSLTTIQSLCQHGSVPQQCEYLHDESFEQWSQRTDLRLQRALIQGLNPNDVSQDAYWLGTVKDAYEAGQRSATQQASEGDALFEIADDSAITIFDADGGLEDLTLFDKRNRKIVLRMLPDLMEVLHDTIIPEDAEPTVKASDEVRVPREIYETAVQRIKNVLWYRHDGVNYPELSNPEANDRKLLGVALSDLTACDLHE